MSVLTGPQFVAMPPGDEWKNARFGSIGASEACAAVGRSLYATPLEIYHRKVNKLDVEDNDAMWWGRELEPTVKKRFMHETGIEIIADPCGMFRHPEHPFMTATPDADLVTAELLECKTTTWKSAMDFGEQGTDEVSEEYIFQCQQQMAVMGRDRVRLAVLVDSPRHLRHFIVDRNQDLIDIMIAREAELWDRIQRRDPPPPDFDHRSTSDLIKAMYGKVNEKTVTLSAELVTMWKERKKLAEEIKAREDVSKVIQDRIRFAMGDADQAQAPGEDWMIRRKEITVKPREGYTYVDMRQVKCK